MDYQYRIRLNFDNRNYMACKTIEIGAMALERKANFLDSTNSSKETSAKVSSRILLQLFPFSLVFGSDLRIVSLGYLMKQIFPSQTLIGKTLTEVARLRRPKLNLTWENVTSARLCFVTAADDTSLNS